jgi:hypothetical protein
MPDPTSWPDQICAQQSQKRLESLQPLSAIITIYYLQRALLGVDLAPQAVEGGSRD